MVQRYLHKKRANGEVVVFRRVLCGGRLVWSGEKVRGSGWGRSRYSGLEEED
jgi:hypothetical protein